MDSNVISNIQHVARKAAFKEWSAFRAKAEQLVAYETPDVLWEPLLEIVGPDGPTFEQKRVYRNAYNRAIRVLVKGGSEHWPVWANEKA